MSQKMLSMRCAAQSIYGGRKQRSLSRAEGSPEDGLDVVSEQQFAQIVLSAKGGCPAFNALNAEAASAEVA